MKICYDTKKCEHTNETSLGCENLRDIISFSSGNSSWAKNTGAVARPCVNYYNI